MLILLPPSEGKTAPPRGRAMQPDRLSFPSLHSARAKVLDALVDLSTTGGATGLGAALDVLGVGRTLADEVARNAHLATAHAARADRVYTGVLYEALDLPSLHGAAKRRATSWVAIASGLFGLVRPGDHIPAYRLSGDVTLPGIGNVAAFWRDQLDDAVREAAGTGLVVDLRSTTYAAFWRPGPTLARRVVTVRVLHEVDGTHKVVSHFNKATKGRIVRSLLVDGRNPRTPRALGAVLTDLGWHVELGVVGRHGTGLDVVVTEF
ncbi:MAG TPA: peroxide stress protein YaaA [Nocardioidaceae bacterium]|nr:peroxide stress protein YaaA [Nocardioidaceae bacterium]